MMLPLRRATTHIISAFGWLHGTAVDRRSLAGKLSLTCARPVADG